jgi:Ca-activated chloride channel homolog
LRDHARKRGARKSSGLVCAVLISFIALLAVPSYFAQSQSQPPSSATAAATSSDQAAPQTQSQKKPGGKPLKLDVDLTLVNVTVTDPYGRLVTGLEQENFRIFEDNAEQEIVRFSGEDVPISIGVIFDMSGSMADKFEKSRLAAVQFFKTANPQDEFCLVNFNDRAQLASPFTASVEELQDRLLYTTAHGQTALFDGIYLGLSQMKGARNSKKALLIISDGGDNHSRYTEMDVRKYLKEADVQMYAIGIYDLGPEYATPEERSGPGLLSELTELTGGRTFRVAGLNDLPDIASKISMELRNQYVLGYRPSNHARDGKWRKIKVRLRPPHGLPPLEVFARSGYFAPGH